MRDNRTQSPSGKQSTATPSNLPKVDKQTQSQRALADVDKHQRNIQLLQKISALK